LDASRRAKNTDGVRELAYRKRDIAALETRYKAVKEALDQLDNELLRDQANLELARYYCFYKGQWEKGLHMLAQVNEPRLQQLAKTDLEGPTDPVEQVSLADEWWSLAEEGNPTAKRHLRARAVHWYRLALPQLPPGLLKSKVEIRLRQAEREDPSLGTWFLDRYRKESASVGPRPWAPGQSAREDPPGY
jgi:hypothetical protein